MSERVSKSDRFISCRWCRDPISGDERKTMVLVVGGAQHAECQAANRRWVDWWWEHCYLGKPMRPGQVPPPGCGPRHKRRIVAPAPTRDPFADDEEVYEKLPEEIAQAF